MAAASGPSADELGKAIDKLVDHLAEAAGVEPEAARQAVLEGRLLETPEDRWRRDTRQLVLIALVGFVFQAVVLGFFYWLLIARA